MKRFMLFAAVAACLMAIPSVALAVDASDVPFGTFHLPFWLEVVIVIGIAALSLMLWALARPLAELKPLGWVAQAIIIVILAPLFEEVIFRFFLIEAVAKGMLGASNTQAFLSTAVLFAVAHLIMAVVGRRRSVLTARPAGIQVCEGLFIGCFTGLTYIMMRFLMEPGIGLLVTMAFGCWLFHMLFNLLLVIFNATINVLLGPKSIVLHVVVRLALLLAGILILVQSYRHGVEHVIGEMWLTAG